MPANDYVNPIGGGGALPDSYFDDLAEALRPSDLVTEAVEGSRPVIAVDEEAEAADIYSSILASGAETAAIDEMPMLGAILGSGSLPGMAGGAIGAAVGGTPGAIIGSQLGGMLAPQETGGNDIRQFLPGNDSSGAVAMPSGDTGTDPLVVLKQMRGYLQTIVKNTAKGGGKGSERM